MYKKGAKDAVSNCRPIALIPIFSKIIEKIMKKQITDFIFMKMACSPMPNLGLGRGNPLLEH